MSVTTIERIPVLTSAEAAEELGLEVSLVCRYCRAGRIDAEKVGRDWIITRKALAKFLAEPRLRGNPSFRKAGH